MKVFVTGIAGFIGSHTAERLHARGDTVFGIDNVNDYYSQDQKRANLRLMDAAGIPYAVLDVRSPAARDALLSFSPDVVVHLAAMAGVRYSIEKPELYYDVNVTGTQNLLSAAAKVGSRVVAASSSSVYGDRSAVPFRETDVVDNQISPYAASKKSLELACTVHHHLTGLPVSCLRFFTVYGPRGRPDMAPYKFMDLMLSGKPIDQYGDGSSARDYTYVGDIVSGIVAAADTPRGFQVYNLGNSTPVTLLEMIDTMEEVCGVPAVRRILPMQAGDVTVTFADISKAREHFNYAPTTRLLDGLRAQHAWFTNEKTW